MYATRFAPTPSGRLHFGSAVAAVGAYLRARSQAGRILLRIEDLDFQRCRQEYTRSIIEDLAKMGLVFDGDAYVQSEHLSFYESALLKASALPEAFFCTCTRAKLKSSSCKCFGQNCTEGALKLRLDVSNETFEDALCGRVSSAAVFEDVTLKRRDKIISYNFACVLDDEYQEITEVVRGQDLFTDTIVQTALQKCLGLKPVTYCHLPLAVDAKLRKFSKQNRAPAVLDLASPAETLILVLKFLNQSAALSLVNSAMEPQKILSTAADHFELNGISRQNIVFDVEEELKSLRLGNGALVL